MVKQSRRQSKRNKSKRNSRRQRRVRGGGLCLSQSNLDQGSESPVGFHPHWNEKFCGGKKDVVPNEEG